MRFNSKVCVKEIVGENAFFLQGSKAGDVTKVIGINDSSLFLWNHLKNKDFTIEDIVVLLCDRFSVSRDVALKDAQAWVSTLSKNSIIIR